MEGFNEYLFKRYKTAKDYIVQVLIFIGCVALSGVAYFLLSFVLGGFFGRILGVFAIIGIVWVGYKQFMRFDREYEYSCLNGEVDVDIIYAKSDRKRIITFNAKTFEIFGEYTEDVKKRYKDMKFDSKFDFSSHNKNSENKVCFAVYNHRNFKKTFMIFEPNERILSELQIYCKLGTGM